MTIPMMTCAALYGVRLNSGDLRGFVAFAEQLLRESGMPPTVAELSRSEAARHPRQTDVETMLRLLSASVSVADVVAYRPRDDAEYASRDVWCSFRVARRQQTCVIQIDSEHAGRVFRVGIERALSLFRVSYAILYEMPMISGPAFYAFGINASSGHLLPTSGPEYERRVQVSRWSAAIRSAAFNDGWIRDVYEYNVLNDSQLRRRVGRSSLKDWIVSSATGVLRPIASGLELWTVPSSLVETARSQLAGASIIYGI